MDERDLDAEIGPEPVDERRRERDLGHEHEGRPAELETGRDRLHVDRRLATAGDALEQERRRVTPVEGRPDQLDGLGLLGA
jgi:hypothetical protein